MGNDKVTMTEVERSRLDWAKQHIATYVGSGGAQGHILDLREVGGFVFSPTLLLRTTGRKSGETRINPVMYGFIHGQVVTVASKGGADVHPAWYLNMQGQDTVDFQIATQAFRASWREPQGAEREEIFDFIIKVFPPYGDYRRIAKREIPLIMMQAEEEIPAFT